MKLTKEKRDRLILIAVTTLVAAAGLWVGVVQTRETELQRCRKQREDLGEKVAKAERWSTKASTIQAERQDVEKRLHSIEDGMAPAADPYAWAYIVMEKARAGHRVDIIDITRPERREVQLFPEFPYKAITFAVRGVGFYQDLGRFLADFENNHPHIQVGNLTLSSTPELVQDASPANVAKDKLFFRMEIIALTKPPS
jgi:hypothetical protein